MMGEMRIVGVAVMPGNGGMIISGQWRHGIDRCVAHSTLGNWKDR
jgi:hypothetical protein